MKYSKFILLRILIDLFFVVGIVFIYLKGASGSIIVRELPVATITGLVVFLGVKNLKNRPIAELVGECILTVLLFMWYVKATENDYDILASDMWFINMLRGLILLLCFYFLLDLIKRYMNSFTKSAQIFYVANTKADYSIVECFIGATIRFKSTLAIPIFNKLIRDCIDKIMLTAKNTLPSAEETETKIDDFFTELTNSKIGKASRRFLKLYTDYVDECVLVYCYMHPEKSLFKASVEAISIFIKNAVKIIEKMAVVIIVQVLIKLGIGGAIILMLVKTSSLTLKKMLFGFIIIKMFEFIIQDAILEPVMMQKILDTFVQLEPDQQTAKTLLDKFPILNKIKGLQNKDDPDDMIFETESTSTEEGNEAVSENVKEETSEGVEAANEQFEQEKENKERNTLL